MAVNIPQEIEAAAAFLAKLNEPDRQQYLGQLKLLYSAQADPESLETPVPIRTLGEYLDTPIEIPPMLVEPGVIVRGGLTAITGRGGKGKTSVNLHRVMKWATGRPMFDKLPDLYVPTKPIKTLIIENEGAAGLFQMKLANMLERAPDLSKDDRDMIRENVLIWGEGGWSDMVIDQPDNLRELKRGLDKTEPDLVFLEPFTSLWSGDENSASEMRDVLMVMIGIAANHNAGVLVAHHETKGFEAGMDPLTASRGSTALEGVTSYQERFAPAQGGKYRELIVAKNRYAPGRGLDPGDTPIRIEWRDDQSGWYEYVPPESSAAGLLSELSCYDPTFVPALATEIGESQDRLRKLLGKLLEDGLVRRESGQSDGRGSSGYAYYKVCSEGVEGALNV